MLNIQQLETKIQKAIPDQTIQMVDESHLHHTHKQYQSTKAYLLIKLQHAIRPKRIENHRVIYQIVEAHCPIPIHALRIQISATQK